MFSFNISPPFLFSYVVIFAQVKLAFLLLSHPFFRYWRVEIITWSHVLVVVMEVAAAKGLAVIEHKLVIIIIIIINFNGK